MQERNSGWRGMVAANGVGRALRYGLALMALLVLVGLVRVDLPERGVRAQEGAGGGNPLLGTWHQAVPAQAGGVIHNFMSFSPEGTFFSTSINEGGGLNVNGMRTQMWGKYTIKPAGNGLFAVTLYYQGRAPQQLCMPGMGCRALGNGPLHPEQGMFQFQGDMFQSNIGFAGERSGIPPVLLQRLPASWMLQPPPPLDVPATGGGGRYVSPRNNIPGLGGNCDDLQQSRVCTTGGGYYHKDRETGCMVCTK